MIDLAALVQEGLGQAVMAVVPLLAAGLGGSVVAGWLAVRMGLTDPVAAGVLRGLAVLAVLVWIAEDLSAQAQTLVDEAWSDLAAVGRAER
ncbi:MAG: hypothetical protein AAGF11_47065 [Myxococcota bacterium]